MAKKKRPTYINQKAKSTVDNTRGEAEDTLKQKNAVKAAASNEEGLFKLVNLAAGLI